ncbi:hypothetical protein MA16_Dca008719 [Dendrobium catenatum]|uniref:Uncharacterized protein n=1 Tax=Dendrobium catenatum TaxID=906689 RepID=A0A2I0W4M6_9ASPA|nr:hypothetical protein MA16_Dca008719 [Dendrobium catenatum]
MSNERCMIVGFNIGRPLDHSLFAPDLMPIYGPCHSRKSINRALISHKRGPKQEREEEKRRKEFLLDSRRTTAESRRTTAGPPQESRRTTAGPPQEPRRTTTKPRRTTTLRPDVHPRRPAKDPTSC